MSDRVFESISDEIDLVEQEEATLEYWNKIDAFKTSLEKSKGRPPYTFYDGPPFATGLPHYGHILAGTIKDIVTRYAHQTGHHVERRFGWDTHGLPIEFEIEKVLGIRTKEEVLKLGIDKYNEACRGIVMRYSSEWEKSVTRLGRWIDFKNDYKTMNPSFMESVWWVFGQLWEKGLVYRGFKVMPYSTACTTPLSNFEANMNYQDVADPEVVVAFKKEGAENTYFLAWTTTPWTLPSNVALCVNPDFDYVEILDKPTQKKYILAKCRLTFLYNKKQQNDYQILNTFKGTTLGGQRYEPLFDYFRSYKQSGGFRILVDTYVTDDSGTGIVHNAPGFGEDDYRVCLEGEIIGKDTEVPCPIDESGRFLSPVEDFKGKYVKDADNDIIAALKKRGLIVKHSSIKHSYPFCWRSDTPLIYRAVPSWFIRVEQIKDRLLENNKKTYWVPDFVKEKRFHNWLESAKDWAVSRSRYWGTPIPVWTNETYTEFVVIDSIAKLEELTGKTITDIHRENIDHLEIPSPSGNGVLRRIEDVFDCWFESGSMPYAQSHYPFENKDTFHTQFPADFIAEGLDQTRGWFYTLMVLGTALFDQPPFKNLIVNGIVLASDGRKMSKRLKNYPDPTNVVDKYGADALRLYLINSPVVRAESLKFQEEGVDEVRSTVFRPWFNAYRFFIQSANSFFDQDPSMTFTASETASFRPTDVMDKWILSLTQSLIKFVREEMAAYRLYTVIPRLVSFIDQLTNWYVRINRPRLKGDSNPEDKRSALMTLYSVLMNLCRLMAPFTPFLTESIYQNLKNLIPEDGREESVHFLMIPEYDETIVDEKIERAVGRLQELVVAARDLRTRKNISMKIPVRSISVCSTDEEYLDDVKIMKEYIQFEVNCKDVICVSEVKDFIRLSVTAKSRELGRRLKQKLGAISKQIAALDHDAVIQFMATKEVTIDGEVISIDDVDVHRTFTGDEEVYVSAQAGSTLVVLKHILDDQLRQEGAIRDLTSAVMRLRKETRLVPEDEVDVHIVASEEFREICLNHRETLEKNLPRMLLFYSNRLSRDVNTLASKVHQIPSICGEYAPITIYFGGSMQLIVNTLTRQTDYYKKSATNNQNLFNETRKALRQVREKQLKSEAKIQELERQVQTLTSEKEKLLTKLKDQGVGSDAKAASTPASSYVESKSAELNDLRQFATSISKALNNLEA